MSLAMTRTEREAFLADRHVAVLAVDADGERRAPLVVPVWYSYEPGGLVTFITGDGSRKARLLRAAGRASLCVQTADVPYRYVAVEGPIVAEEHPAEPEERRAMARRYLDAELGDAYIAGTVDVASTMTTFRLLPEQWHSEDQSRRAF
jgi:nitroimidazol reductase NimA-like FMN-containing flavoprotein (pyridoxamine 5'-phosphate oxidase superfamily)